MYLVVRKKKGQLFGEEMLALHRKIHDVSKSVFTWFGKEHNFINERYFFDFKVIKEVSNYHFHYFLISSDKCVNKYF